MKRTRQFQVNLIDFLVKLCTLILERYEYVEHMLINIVEAFIVMMKGHLLLKLPERREIAFSG